MFLRQRWVIGGLLGAVAALVFARIAPGTIELNLIQAGLVSGGAAGGALASLVRPAGRTQAEPGREPRD